MSEAVNGQEAEGILFSRGDLWRSMTAAIFGCGTWRSSERPNGIQKASPISNTTTAQILIDHSRKQILDL